MHPKSKLKEKTKILLTSLKIILQMSMEKNEALYSYVYR